jgi:hypothetical protein
MIPPCPCCARVVSEADVVPDGCYIFGSRSLVSFKCPCGTNRAIRFEDATQELRRAAMLAELARDKESEMMGWGG